MCGIAGAFQYKTRTSVTENSMSLALKDIRHRGPDDHRFVIDKEYASGMTRLSIVGLQSPCGPLRSASGRYSIVFNGEIYNYKEIRKDLIDRGYDFKTDTDTEVILALYDLGEPNPESILRGMFAYAIFDHKLRQLILSRDRLGKKPLFFVETNQGLAFGSEIKLLSRFPGVQLRPDFQSIGNFLSYGYTPGPRTAFEGIDPVPAGHRLICTHRGWKFEKYWQLTMVPEGDKTPVSNYESALDALEYQLSEAVRYRMIADVPIGIFLSSGIDSSMVLALAQKTKPVWPIQAFTIDFDSRTEGEANIASEIARQFGVQHETILFGPKTFESVFSRAVYCSDNLLANPAMFANFQLSLVAGRQIKAALNGGGGDELFYGYPTYRADYLRAKLVSPLSKALSSLAPLTNFLPTSHEGIGLQYQARKFLEGVAYEPGRSHYWWRSLLVGAEKEDLFHPPTPIEDAYRCYERIYQKYPNIDSFERFALSDLEVWWKDMGLYQSDAMSMANSLELRVPMMDHELVEFAFSLPRDLKFSPKRTKPMLRDLGYRILPKSILELKKRGFHVPFNEWFARPLSNFVEEKLSEDRLAPLSFLNPIAVRRVIDRHQRRQEDASYKIMNLMVLVEWYHQFILGEKVHSP